MDDKLVIAIDFDGTIVQNKFPDIGTIKPDAKRIINKLFKEGHELILWTCRSDLLLLEATEFLRSVGIPFHSYNINSDKVTFGCDPKIYADIYIDDKSLFGLPDWQTIYQIVQERYNEKYGN